MIRYISIFFLACAALAQSSVFYNNNTRQVLPTNLIFLRQTLSNVVANTPTFGDDSTKVATTEFVQDAIAAAASSTSAWEYVDALSTGTNAYFRAGTIDLPNNTSVYWPGGIVTNIASMTNYIGINMYSGRVVCLRRNVDSGTLFFGTIICNSNSITSGRGFKPQIPLGYVERFKSLSQHNYHRLKVVLQGNSIMANTYGDTTNQWVSAMFSSPNVALPTTYVFPYSTNYNIVRRCYGGQRSLDGWLFLGKGISTFQSTNNNRSTAWMPGQDYIARHASTNLYMYDNELQSADLVIIMDLFNGGRDNLLAIDRMVEYWRGKGAEVVLCVDHTSGVSDPNQDATYQQVVAIRDYRGCALADVQSYSKELQYKGVVVHVPGDPNHPNQNGNNVTAECVRGVTSAISLPQVQTTVQPMAGRAARVISYDYPNVWTPEMHEYQFFPTDTTGSYVATAFSPGTDFYKCHPAINLAKRDASVAVLELEAGEYADFAHPWAMLARFMLERKASASVLQIRAMDGTVLETYNVDADSPRLVGDYGIISDFLLPDTGNYNDPTGFETNAVTRNTAVRFFALSGTTRFVGVGWGTRYNEEIPVESVNYTGSWYYDTYAGFASFQSTDLTGSYLDFTYEGDACAIVFAVHPAAGKVNITLDNKSIYSALDLYNGTGSFTRTVMIGSDMPYAGYGTHTIRISADTANPAAISPTVGLRRLHPVGFYKFGKRTP